MKTLLMLFATALTVLGSVALGGKVAAEFNPTLAVAAFGVAIACAYLAVRIAGTSEKRGTAIELAVLIGLSFVITNIVYPVMQGARSPMKKTLCISSAKQVGVAVLMYQGDYDDRYPPGTKWRTLVDPYRRGKPTETSGEPDQTLRCPEAIQPWTYALNSALSGYDGDKVADSMATVLVFDSGGKVPDLTGGVGDFALRHSGKGTVVFGDGRTVLADAPQLRWHP